ncbi:MAG: hypothetical protein JWN71_2963 [Xanthobacteraceae bacterium]|nr:hypothetical protein [Xanthobacteraceae bacterium]
MYAHAEPKPVQTTNSVRVPQRQTADVPTAQTKLEGALNSSARVQSQLHLSDALNQSPRAAVQAKLIQLMSSPAPFGRMSDGQGLSDEEELIQSKSAVQRQEMDEDDLLQQMPVQREGLDEDELAQMKSTTAQREDLDEDELAQMKAATAQREGMDEDELAQMKSITAQREDMDEDELAQMKSAAQRQEMDDEELTQMKSTTAQRQDAPEEDELLQQMPVQRRANTTGMPDQLKSGIEGLSGMSMDGVQVHYNSSKPASLQAHAYTQGSDIHVAPGQEQHLPHEAWHVVQQAQGRVQPTMQLQGTAVNDDPGLEDEADVMGAKALQLKAASPAATRASLMRGVAQRLVLPLDDVAALKHDNPKPTKEELESSQIISTAVERRTGATHENVVRPWNTRNRLLLNWGPLDNIGNEDIRIFGHGAHAPNSDIALQVGGYTPSQLVALLKDLGLKSTYAGQIYLSGCLTAGGDKLGYLGAFYDLLKAYAPAVRVRGNLGNAITLENGKQAIFKTSQDRDLYKTLQDRTTELAKTFDEQTQAFKMMGLATTQTELAAKQALKDNLLKRQNEIVDLYDQLRDIFYATEDQGDLTVELPDAKLPAFDQSGFDLFQSPSVISDATPNVSISELLKKAEALDTTTSFSFPKKKEKKLFQFRAADRGAKALPRNSAMLRVAQRVIVTIHDMGADEASKDIQYNTMHNLRTAKKDNVVDTFINLDDNRLGKIGANETLYVVGHGSSNTISGKSPSQLLTELEDFGLTNAFKGLIDLTSCYSGEYVAAFTQALRQKDYENDVKGYAGLVHVTPQGDFEVVPKGNDKPLLGVQLPGSATVFLDVMNSAKVAYRKEKAALDDKLQKAPSDPAILLQLERLDSNYNGIVAKLNAMFEPSAEHEVFSSPEARKRHSKQIDKRTQTPTTIEEAIEFGHL